MAQITPATIVEWLKRRGGFKLPSVEKRLTLRRWLRERLFIALSLALGIGIVLGCLLRLR
jgi:hypothetical protein